MRILLLGAGGQLAHDLKRAFHDQDVVGLTRAKLDLRDRERLDARLDEVRPAIVVNAAAYNLVDRAESEPVEAFAVNAFAARNVAQACGERDLALVHFSTDYVFGLEEARDRPWRTDDLPGPVSVYGASKLAGEHMVRAYCPKHFVIRTCGLYGVKGSRGKGGNFVETMLRLAQGNGPVRVVNDQTCTPSYTRDIAEVAVALLRTGRFGLYHATNSGHCTWFELAREIFAQSGLKVDCRPITTAEFAAAARRPAYSVLDLGSLDAAGVDRCPEWKDALSRYLAERRRPASGSA